MKPFMEKTHIPIRANRQKFSWFLRWVSGHYLETEISGDEVGPPFHNAQRLLPNDLYDSTVNRAAIE